VKPAAADTKEPRQVETDDAKYSGKVMSGIQETLVPE
jgi:hypothetical protein